MDNFIAQEMSQEMTKKVRKYFKSNHSLMQCIGFIFLGLMLVLIGREVIGVLLIGLLIAGIGIYWIVGGSFAGEEEADQAKAAQVEALKQRGISKVNLVKEQLELVEPIVLVGLGCAPDQSFTVAKVDKVLKENKLKNFIKWLIERTKEYDPEVVYLIGSDEKLRSLLVEVTVFYVTEGQLYMYVGDVDISTGLIYRENISECYYQDIEAVRFQQKIYKAFHRKSKTYVNKLKEDFVLFLGGAQFSASVNSEVGTSILDEKFTAMRNLIREKKTIE